VRGEPLADGAFAARRRADGCDETVAAEAEARPALIGHVVGRIVGDEDEEHEVRAVAPPLALVPEHLLRGRPAGHAGVDHVGAAERRLEKLGEALGLLDAPAPDERVAEDEDAPAAGLALVRVVAVAQALGVVCDAHREVRPLEDTLPPGGQPPAEHGIVEGEAADRVVRGGLDTQRPQRELEERAGDDDAGEHECEIREGAGRSRSAGHRPPPAPRDARPRGAQEVLQETFLRGQLESGHRLPFVLGLLR
jgi:hypothetical protein